MAQIKIMSTRHSAFYSPLIYTIAGGFLKTEGLEPTYAVATPERPVMRGTSEGAVHVGQSAPSASFTLLERGQTPDVAHFAQINERDGFFIAARRPDANFSWSKLIGKKVLVDHGGQPLAMFKFACHKQGMDFTKIEAINAGDAKAIDKAFREGQGDYVHQQGPSPQQLEKDGAGHVVASVGEAIGPVAFSSLVASRKWLATDMAQAFMRAYRKARRAVNETPAAEIARAEADFFKGIDKDVLARTIAFYQKLGCWNPDPRITRAAYEVTLDVFLHSGLITKRHPYEAVVAPPPDAA